MIKTINTVVMTIVVSPVCFCAFIKEKYAVRSPRDVMFYKSVISRYCSREHGALDVLFARNYVSSPTTPFVTTNVTCIYYFYPQQVTLATEKQSTIV